MRVTWVSRAGSGLCDSLESFWYVLPLQMLDYELSGRMPDALQGADHGIPIIVDAME